MSFLWLRAVLFTLLIPATVAGYIPHWMMRNRVPDMDIGMFRWAGLPVICLGVLIYLWTAISFLLKGKGTPAIWFIKAIRFIIGEEPVKMVSSGLYKYSRNPMYLGVITTTAGQGLFFQYSNVLWYALFLFIAFNFVVVFIEEPHLQEKFGDEYKAYKKRTRRWL